MMQYRGLYRNTDPINQPDGTSPFAKNMEIDRKTGAVVPEKGNQLTAFVPAGYSEIGSESIGETIILCVAETTPADPEVTINKFITVDNGTITEKLDIALGYNASSKVKLIPFYNRDNNLIVISNDSVNPPYILNLDGDNENPELFLNLTVPNFQLRNIGSSGNLKSGAYYIAVAYKIDDYVTNYVYLSRPIIINNISTSASYDTVHDYDKSRRTNKSITFALNGLDQKFNKVQISIISVIDGVTSAVTLPEFRITSNFIYTYTGFEQTEDELIEEILIDQPFYKKVDDITMMHNTLFASSPQAAELSDNEIQLAANNIIIEPVAEYVSLNTISGSHKDGETIFNFPTFMPFEVYAFYITPILKNGTKYKSFHIPGRVATGDDTSLITTQLGKTEKFRIIGTSNVTYLDIPGTNDKKIKAMTMGYWENENEQYPDDFPGGLAGLPVRHHRMPSQFDMIQALFQTNNFDPEDFEQSDITYKLSTNANSPNVLTDTQVNEHYNFSETGFPSQYMTRSYDVFTANGDRIVKLDYNIVYALFLRGNIFSKENVQIIILYEVQRLDGSKQTFINVNKKTDARSFSGISGSHKGSHEFIMASGDKLIMRTWIRYSNGNAGALFQVANNLKVGNITEGGSVKGAVLGIKVSNVNLPTAVQEQIQGYEIGYAVRNEKTVIDECPVVSKKWTIDVDSDKLMDMTGQEFRTYPFSILQDPEKRLPHGLFLQTTKGIKTKILDSSRFGVDYVTSILYGTEEDTIVKPNNMAYLPANNIATTPKNKDQEASIRFTTTTAGLGVINDTMGKNSIILGSLCSLMKNVYQPFDNQLVVSSGFVHNPATDPEELLFFGDAFINMYGLRITSETADIDNNDTFTEKDYININVPCYSNLNIGLRAKGDQWHETFYPLSGEDRSQIIPEELSGDNIDHYDYGDYYGYNHDYNSLQTLKSGFPSSRPIQTNFLFRVIKNVPVSRESDHNLFRRFLPADYYESVKNMGPIQKLDVYDERLIIHHRDCLFMTRDKIRLKSDALSVTLGSGDIFEFEPQPVVDTQKGYAGIQDKWSGLVTPAGYCFCDTNRIFLMTGEQLKNIGGGLTNELREGIAQPRLGFNPYNNQIYISFLHFSGNQMTISYVPTLDFWAFFHDYIPTGYLYTKENFYSLYNNQFYLHNYGDYGMFYGTQYPAIFDKVFNFPQESIVNSVEWVSEPENNMFDNYSLWNGVQHTGEVQLVEKKSIYESSTVFRNRNLWFVNKFQDKVTDPNQAILQGVDQNFTADQNNLSDNIPWYKSKQIQGNYVTFRLQSSGKYITLSDLKVNVTPSVR